MDETVDVQEQAIGAGSIVALACVAYGRFIDETLFGVDATTLGLGAFAATFAAVALLHVAYGRRDFAVSHAVSAVGLGLVVLASSMLQMLVGLVLLVGGGSYTARTTIRARNEATEERETAPENA